MAGGPSTPDLVVAAAEAGALGFLAGGYKTADAMVGEIDEVRRRTDDAFGVNLFVPGSPTDDQAALHAYLASLAPDAEALAAELGRPVWDDDGWSAKLAALMASPPPVVTFTFGCPSPDVVSGLAAAGTVVGVTVTTAGEATAAAAAGAQFLCAQGSEAGAHRGSFANAPRGDAAIAGALALCDVLAEVGGVTDLPLVAAGGIVDATGVGTALGAGAVAAQCGTAFLRCPESAAAPLHKAALADGRFTETAFTRSFSGRPARGLVNRFVREHTDAPAAYPEVNNATRPLRAAAAASGDPERMSLWAGTGFRSATDRPAGEVVELLGAS